MDAIGAQDRHAVAIVEAALLLEAGAGEPLQSADCGDVYAGTACRSLRGTPKDRIEAARKEVLRRMAAQFPDEEKIKAAHFVIDNSGSLEKTRNKSNTVWANLRAEADQS